MPVAQARGPTICVPGTGSLFKTRNALAGCVVARGGRREIRLFLCPHGLSSFGGAQSCPPLETADLPDCRRKSSIRQTDQLDR